MFSSCNTIAALTMTASIVCIHGASAEQLCERDVLPFDAMLANLKAEPDVKVFQDTPTLVELSDMKRMIIWTLSRPDESLRSAYVCRRVVQEDGKVLIRTSAQCLGTTPGCDGLIARILAAQNAATAPLRRP